MSIANRLAQYGLTLDEARAFVFAHLDQPALIYETASAYGVGFADLAEIVGGGVTTEQVQAVVVGAQISPLVTLLAQQGLTLGEARGALNELLDGAGAQVFALASEHGLGLEALAEISGQYSGAQLAALFSGLGLDPAQLEGGDGGGGAVPMFPQGLPEVMQRLVALNTHEGVLSTEVLRAKVLAAGITEAQYGELFSTARFQGAEDGVFSPEELGFSHLGSVDATPQTLESLYYGTLINTFNAIDEEELEALFSFMPAEDGSNMAEWLQLQTEVFGDPGNPPYLDAADLSDALAGITAAVALTGQPVPLFGFGGFGGFGGLEG